MRKGIYTALILCLIIAVIGVGLVIAGISLGGRPNFRLDWRTHTITTADNAEARGDLTPEPFTTLQIEVATADIFVERGDGWSLSYALSEEPEITQENGVLKLKLEERSGMNFVGISFSTDSAPYIKITVPADAALEEITIATATGEVTLSELEAERIELACATGDISLNGKAEHEHRRDPRRAERAGRRHRGVEHRRRDAHARGHGGGLRPVAGV